MPPEKPKTPNQKLEANDPEPPKKKALRRYEEGEAPAQSVSTDEEHHRQIPILMPLRHRKYALKSVP